MWSLIVNIIKELFFSTVSIANSIFKIFLHSMGKKKNIRKAKELLGNWIKLKSILENYQKTNNNDLQGEYVSLREKMAKSVNYFLKEIIEILSLKQMGESHRVRAILGNFEECWSPREISKWQDLVRRNVPRELDCFDYILYSLMGKLEK